MTEKTYKIGDAEYTIKGSDSLHEFIGKLQAQSTELQTKLDSSPKYGEQRALWSKAEPYFSKAKKEIKDDMSITDIMRTTLELAGYDVTDIDDSITRYMFNKVLKAPDSSNDNGESGSKSNNSATNTNTQTKPSKPNVKEPASNNGLSSEELGDAWLTRRMSGELVSNNGSTNN